MHILLSKTYLLLTLCYSNPPFYLLKMYLICLSCRFFWSICFLFRPLMFCLFLRFLKNQKHLFVVLVLGHVFAVYVMACRIKDLYMRSVVWIFRYLFLHTVSIRYPASRLAFFLFLSSFSVSISFSWISCSFVLTCTEKTFRRVV